MDRKQIEQWGEEADAYACTLYNSEVDAAEWHAARDDRFAALVAAHEREQCAVVCDKMGNPWRGSEDCAAAIRERGAPNDKTPPTPEGAGGK